MPTAAATLRHLIYRRAEERGIRIERGPRHRSGVDHVGAGRRRVSIGGRTYYYRASLVDIGLRWGLVTREEVDAAILADGGARCPRCGRVQRDRSVIDRFGYCLNC
jgi:hypothetical protein